MYTPQEAISRMRESFPGVLDSWTDEAVYRLARRKYPDAKVQDWEEIGYVTRKKQEKDPADIYLQKTDEDSFLDYFNWGIDEDSSYLARLAYSRSLQGMVDDFTKGKPKFELERQPNLLEEGIAGIMAFGMPLDALSLIGGGGILAKAVLSKAGSQALTKHLAKKVVTKAPGLGKIAGGRAGVETSIRNIIGSELMYVPYEGAKANMYAQTEHIRNPEIAPLSNNEILKETFAGIVHGGVMGVMGGSARPFMAARHTKLLNSIANLERKQILTGKRKNMLFKLKDNIKYTGQFPQYATDVAGLTLGDITGTAIAYGQIKSGEEALASLLTMGGFAGATRAAGLGLNKVVMEPLEKAKTVYKNKYDERKRILEKEENLQNIVNEKSDFQLDTEAETKAKDNSFDSSISKIQEERLSFDESEAGKKYNTIKKDVEVFEENNKRKIKEGKAIDGKEALEFYQERIRIFSEISAYFQGADMFDDVARLGKWMDEGESNAMKSITQAKTTKSNQKLVLLDMLEDEKVTTIRMDVTNEAGVKKATDVDLNDVETVIQKENPNFTPEQVLDETVNRLQSRYDIKQGSKAAKPVDDKVANDIIKSLNLKDAQLDANIKRYLDMGEAGEDIVINYRTAKDIKAQLDLEIENLKNLDLTDSERNAARQNILLVQTFVTGKLPEFTMGSGTGAGSKIDKKRLKGYANGVINLYKKFRGAGEDVSLGNISADKLRTYVMGLSGDSKSGVIAFYRFLQNNDGVSTSVRNTINDLFKLEKLVPQPKKIGIESSSFKFSKDSVTVTYPAGKAKGLRLTGLVASKVKSFFGSKDTYKSLMERVIKLSKKIKIKGFDEATQKPITVSVPFFAFTKKNIGDNLEPKSIGLTTAGKLSKSIFGVNLKEFRKGESTFIVTKEGITSNDFLLLDAFGLGHTKIKQTDISAAGKNYIAQLKIDKNTGLPTSKEAFNTLKKNKTAYQKLIFDGKTSAQLEKMPDKQLFKKYGVTKKSLNYAEGISIYQLKKGYENLNKISKNADKTGYLYFNNEGSIITNPKDKSIKMSIHKDVLEGLFRTFSETSARINDIVATPGNKKGVLITDSGKFISKTIDSLINKSGIKIKDNKKFKDIDYSKLETKKNDKFKTSSLERNSTDDLTSLKIKQKLLQVGGRHGDFSRANLGDKKYEKILKSLLKIAGMTNADIKKMKKISLQDDMIDEAIVSKINKYMECG